VCDCERVRVAAIVVAAVLGDIRPPARRHTSIAVASGILRIEFAHLLIAEAVA
jgi:hypothetical protein